MTPPYVLQPNEEDIYDEMIFYLVQNNFGSYNECLKMTPEIFYRYKRTEVKTQAMQKLIMSVKNAKS